VTKTQQRKQAIREFMRNHYTDERLVWLLEHARQGKLAFISCCCLVGIATADHALTGFHQRADDDVAQMFGFSAPSWKHYDSALRLSGARRAEHAYNTLAKDFDDAKRRRILIPMVKAEIRRRERERQNLQIAKALINEAIEITALEAAQ